MSELDKSDYIKDIIIKARKELLVEKNPLNAINILTELLAKEDVFNNKFLKSTLALAYLENKNYLEASKIFYDINEKYQAGFCQLLLGNEDIARDLWFKSPESEINCWGQCLIDMIELKVNNLPTFMQIRNHLECDIGYFIQANTLNYAENVIKCAEVLSSINPETYKFIGKALLYNGFADLSVNYFIKAQQLIPQDAEVYYHLGQYSYNSGAHDESKHILKQCLALNEYYVPAKQLLQKVESTLKLH